MNWAWAYTGGGARGRAPRTQSFHTFKILNSRVKNIKKLVCCSFSALRRLYTWTRATMTEVRMKIYLEWTLHRPLTQKRLLLSSSTCITPCLRRLLITWFGVSIPGPASHLPNTSTSIFFNIFTSKTSF